MLVMRIQPNEGFELRTNAKVPGSGMEIRDVHMDFDYSETFGSEPPEAYERLIHDAMIGEQTLFIRGDEAEAAWAVIDPIEQGWDQSKIAPFDYTPNTWGPKAAMQLIENDGRRWMQSQEKDEPVIACSI